MSNTESEYLRKALGWYSVRLLNVRTVLKSRLHTKFEMTSYYLRTNLFLRIILQNTTLSMLREDKRSCVRYITNLHVGTTEVYDFSSPKVYFCSMKARLRTYFIECVYYIALHACIYLISIKMNNDFKMSEL